MYRIINDIDKNFLSADADDDLIKHKDKDKEKNVEYCIKIN